MQIARRVFLFAIFVFSVGMVPTAHAVSSSVLDLQEAVTEAAGGVLPTVVNVSVRRSVERPEGFSHPNLPAPFDEMFRRQMQDMPEVQEAMSLGSGFIIDGDGYILTNGHVVKEADEIEVTLLDERSYAAEVVGTDTKTDIALLKIEPDGEIPSATLGSSSGLRVGQWAIAIGNPFNNFEGTVTLGIVSARGRSSLNFGRGTPNIQDYIQTDASINPGNSGGPLVDIHGRVIGINSAISSPTGGNVGIGFAIPIDMVKEVLTDLREYGEVRRAYLGVNIQEVDGPLAEALGLEGPEGVLVSEVMEGTPAENAGIIGGDVIVDFNGEAVPTIPKLQRMVGSAEIGSKARVGIIRDGKRREYDVVLESMNDAQVASSSQQPAQEWLGIEVAGLDSPAAERLGVEANKGVVVVSVEQGTSAQRSGLHAGFVIQQIGGFDIADISDWRDAVSELKGKEGKRPLAVYVDTGRGQRYLAIAPQQ